DGDGHVTLKEVRRYAYDRTYQLLRQRGLKADQDGECDWSLSVSDGLKLAVAGPRGPKVAEAPPPKAPAKVPAPRLPPVPGPGVPAATAKLVGSLWVGSETLPGFGKLSFEFIDARQVVMVDAKETAEGTWSQKGNQVTLRFYGGRVVYTGTLE